MSAQDNGTEVFAPETDVAEGQISLLDLLLVLVQDRRIVFGLAFGIILLGLTYSLIADETYTSYATVIREAESEVPEGLSGGLSALRGLGVSLGGITSGLAPEAYPDIIRGRSVRLAVARDTFYFAEHERNMTYTEYVEMSAESGVSLSPRKALSNVVKVLLSRDTEMAPVDSFSYPTEIEEETLEYLEDVIRAGVNEENGLMSVGATTGDPIRSAQVAKRFLHHLSERVSAIRTEKSRRNVEFVRSRFNMAEQELKMAEEQLAQFLDQNQGIQSAQMRVERDRLERQVRFKSELYSELQRQLTQSELSLQRSEPVLTVVEPPTPPTERSAPQRTLIVLISIIMGGVLGIGVAFTKAFVSGSIQDEEERAKYETIRAELQDMRIIHRFVPEPENSTTETSNPQPARSDES